MGAEPDTQRMRELHEAKVASASADEEFDQAMNAMLKELGTSHTGFFHEKRPRAAGRIAIAATLTKAERHRLSTPHEPLVSGSARGRL